ncbi:hypothetical protein EON73_04960 [bacterium]|nr:MAG: hypothetical protein EON73_04960 [bacterium]
MQLYYCWIEDYKSLKKIELNFGGKYRFKYDHAANKLYGNLDPDYIENFFPSGISQITLFNAEDQAINERSFFINHQDNLQISINTSSTSFNVRDSIPLQLLATNAGETV